MSTSTSIERLPEPTPVRLPLPNWCWAPKECDLIREYGDKHWLAGWHAARAEAELDLRALLDELDALRVALKLAAERALSAQTPGEGYTPDGFWLAPMRADDLMSAAVLGKWNFSDAAHKDVQAAYCEMRDSWIKRHLPKPPATPSKD